MKTKIAFAALAAIVGFSAADAAAQPYPSRPIKLLVPIPAGGAPDIAARLVGERLTEALGQPVVIENRPGGNGNLASEMVVNAAPDGYTLTLCADSQIVINPHLYTTMTFDTRKDLALVATVASNEFVLSVNPKIPVNTLQEFVDYARKANPPLAYASGGNGSQHHLTMEMLKQRAGINLIHVPYRGGAPATTATVQGETSAMFAGSSSAPMIKAGSLRGLASTGEKRSAAFPELPAIAEIYPGFQNSIWLAVFAPAATPQPILTRLHTEINKVLTLPDTKERLNRAGGLDPFISEASEFKKRIDADYEKFAKIVKDVGIKVD